MPKSLIVSALLYLWSVASLAAPLLTESFEAQGKWKKNVRGKGAIELVDGGVHGKCLKVVSEDKALAYYSIELDPKQVAGRRIIIRSQVKLDGVAIGPEVYSTAKLHVGIKVGGKTEIEHNDDFEDSVNSVTIDYSWLYELEPTHN